MSEEICPVCASPMSWESQESVLTYKGMNRSVSTLGYWCHNCGEAIFTGAPLLEREKAYFELKAEVDGVLKPDEVTAIRKRLGLSQREAGELLGDGPRAFCKYESGKEVVSTSLSHLLRLLDKDPTRLKELPSSAGKDAAAIL